MLVLLAAAATLAAAPLQTTPVVPKTEARPPATERTPNLYSEPARCGALHEDVVRRIRTAQQGRQSLKQYAVLRKVDGCGVPAPAGYHPDYLLPGHADAPQYRPIDDKPR